MANIIKFDKLTSEDVLIEYPVLFETFKESMNLTADQAIIAVSIATGVCPYCWENSSGCQCWNDE